MESNSPPGGTTIIPSELNGPLPRRVRSSPAGARWNFLAVGVVALMLAGASWLDITSVQQFQDQAALPSKGIEATGQITSLGRYRSGFLVRYSFTVNGLTFTGQTEVSSELRHSISESSTLPIRYLPTNPAVNHPVAWEESLNHWYGYWFGLMFATMVPVILGIRMLLSDHKERRLLAEGLPAIATITDFYIVPGLVPSRGPRARDYIIPDSELGGGKHDQYSKYEFRTRDGGIYTGSIKFNDSQKIGTSLCVIYLPQNPWRNLPYPRYDFRVDL